MKFLKTEFPFRAAVLYTIVAGVWIILSDRLITRITIDPIKLTFLQTYKGWGFVIVTAGILYLFLRGEWNKLQKEIRSRRQAEEELRKSKARLDAAQKVARMGDFTLDMETGDVTWSEGLYDLLRFEKGAPVDFDRIDTQIHHPEDRERIHQWLEDCIASGRNELTPNEYRLLRKDGKTLFVRTVGVIQRSPGKKPRFFATVQDITALQEAEHEKSILEKQLTQAQKMEAVGRLSGGVAHDFNNMLGVILGRTELLLMQMAEDDPHYADLEEIYKAGRRSADLTRQLLAFARKQTISPRVLNLNDTVEEMLKMLRRLIGEDIDLLWNPGGDIWPIKMDPSQVDQLLANLCVNARDAISGTGKVTVETKNAVFDEAYCNSHVGFKPGRYTMLAVTDDGCGMDKDTQSHLFEPFYTTKETGRGTGLGLATVYGIVKQNKGFINVYSETGKGTTFRIYIPRHEEEGFEDEEEKTENIPMGKGETVLLVEDEPGILIMGKMMLERLGYRVLTSNDTDEVMEVVGECPDRIDLLITDIVMPGMSGKDLAKQLQEMRPGIKTLYMSGYTASAISHRGILEDTVHFLQKPFSIISLAVKIREVLEQT